MELGTNSGTKFSEVGPAQPRIRQTSGYHRLRETDPHRLHWLRGQVRGDGRAHWQDRHRRRGSEGRPPQGKGSQPRRGTGPGPLSRRAGSRRPWLSQGRSLAVSLPGGPVLHPDGPADIPSLRRGFDGSRRRDDDGAGWVGRHRRRRDPRERSARGRTRHRPRRPRGRNQSRGGRQVPQGAVQDGLAATARRRRRAQRVSPRSAKPARSSPSNPRSSAPARARAHMFGSSSTRPSRRRPPAASG